MKKQCKRKHYALVNPLAYVLESIELTSSESLDKLRIRELSAIEAFAKGKAGLQEWTDVNGLLTITETMARNGIGDDAMESCKLAQDALIEAAKRYEKTKRMGTTGSGLQSFRALFICHDQQRQLVGLGEYEKMIQKGINRINSKAPEVISI